MNRELFPALAVSLIMTLLLEIGFFLLIGKRQKKDLLLLVLVNILTNPPVVLLYWLAVLYTDLNASLIKIPLELFAIFTEGYLYNKYGQNFKRPYLFSAAANLFSYGIGALLQLFFRRYGYV
ncbi:MAG: hypothetical protein FWF85_05835 [Clostridiales bacterium]|jgi:hypothetical protein|nr:hypothetical protein [Clostridiales bacterium]MDR2712653.1 hypothetical protein [Clostridiales bacterium]